MSLKDTREGYNKYMREYHLKRYHRIRKEAIEKLGGKCNKCGSTEKLQLDHIDPKNKSFDVSLFLSVPLKLFREELKKCQVLCFNCHSIKSILEQGKIPARGTHRTLSAYRYCRCKLCKKEKRDWQKKYRIKKGIVPKTKEIVHGTRKGYLKELRGNIKTCLSCRLANNIYTKNLRNKPN